MVKSFLGQYIKREKNMLKKFSVGLVLSSMFFMPSDVSGIEFIKIPSKVKNWWHEQESTIDVGYLEITGTIEDSKEYVEQLEDFECNPSIKGVLVKINSGGGVPGASEITFNTLSRVRRKKPVVVFVENFCCSGAYWIA